MDRRQIAAWAGMLGPALFVAVFTVEGLLRPGYDARSMYISELALGSRGWVQTASFLLLGALLLVFARGVAAAFPHGRASRAGPILLTIIGVSFLASGIFVMDPASTPRAEMSLHGRLHTLFGALVFSLSPVTCFVFLRRFWADPMWRPLRWWTLAAGMVSAAAIILQSVGPAPPPAAPNAFNVWVGVIQRSALVPFLLWVSFFAFALHRRHALGRRRYERTVADRHISP